MYNVLCGQSLVINVSFHHSAFSICFIFALFFFQIVYFNFHNIMSLDF